MEDRELLELAAKAAGYNAFAGHAAQILDSGWNPLTDDGDALRLAVRLNMLCDFGSHGCLVEAKEGNGPCTEVGDYRRAIVRAAAEIGRTK